MKVQLEHKDHLVNQEEQVQLVLLELLDKMDLVAQLYAVILNKQTKSTKISMHLCCLVRARVVPQAIPILFLAGIVPQALVIVCIFAGVVPQALAILCIDLCWSGAPGTCYCVHLWCPRHLVIVCIFAGVVLQPLAIMLEWCPTE